MSLRIKNVIMKNYKIEPIPKGLGGLDIIHRKESNNENYMTLTGTKQQINRYLQDKPILSDRLRTLNNVPKYRIINTTKERIY